MMPKDISRRLILTSNGTSYNDHHLDNCHHVPVYLPDFSNEPPMLPMHHGNSCLVRPFLHCHHSKFRHPRPIQPKQRRRKGITDLASLDVVHNGNGAYRNCHHPAMQHLLDIDLHWNCSRTHAGRPLPCMQFIRRTRRYLNGNSD